ncbi:sensor histidine kinase [Enorma massiliensis]|uniref:sensor histidine kinase n=1 Tax=Enorma massiliensis TaxID=1472761 RepID=UPI0032085A3E
MPPVSAWGSAPGDASAWASASASVAQPPVSAATDNDALFERLQAAAGSRVVATAILFVLLFAIVGLDELMLFLVMFFVGYLLLDRFVNVRQCIVLGGVAWLVVILLGNLVIGSTSVPIFFSIDYLFMFCGFLFALAVCMAFFIGRAMYEHGVARGQEEADRSIAMHIVGRLIDHPDDWSGLDGDYLECESAINRVRERQRAVESAVRDEARRKDDLVTYLAHDLKTPLASVVGYLSLLEEAPDLPAEQRVHFTGIALEKAHRLDALIEEFFDITRFDFHDIVLTRGYVDLNLMLGQVVDEFYPTLTEQGKTVDLEVPLGLTALIDGDKMARVFNNVMKNAIAYSYEGSAIRITAERAGMEDDMDASAAAAPAAASGIAAAKRAGTPSGIAAAKRAAVAKVAVGEPARAKDAGEVIIRFENQGDPIPEPKLKVIFEKFYRLDAARATNRGGAGLGLAIAKEIVTAHGGAISCESTPEHTVFTIVLPA